MAVWREAKKIPEGTSAEQLGDWMLTEWDSLMTPMMLLPENGGGVTKFQGQWPKVCKKIDKCLAVHRSKVDKERNTSKEAPGLGEGSF